MSELKDLVSNFYKSCQLCLIKKPEDEDFQNILGTFLKNKIDYLVYNQPMVEELTNIVCKECVEQVNKLAHFKRQSQKSLDLIKEASKAPIPKTQKGCQMCLKSQQKDGDFQNIKGTFMKNKIDFLVYNEPLNEQLTNLVCKDCIDQVNKLAHFKKKSLNSLELIKEAMKIIGKPSPESSSEVVASGSGSAGSKAEDNNEETDEEMEEEGQENGDSSPESASSSGEDIADDSDFQDELKAKQGHYRYTSGNKQYKPKEQCQICGLWFKMLKDHLFRHSGVKNFECETCGKKFGHKTHLKNHMMMHLDIRTAKCEVCFKMFRNAYNLKNHMIVHDKLKKGFEPEFTCEICNSKFCHKESIRHHLKMHSQERDFVCEVCGRGFLKNYDLTKHFRLHSGIRPYSCTECGKTFISMGALSSHTVTNHTKERAYVCQYCQRSFVQLSGYKKHQTRRHGIIFPKGVSRMKFKNILHKREEGVKNAIPEQVIENQSEETNQSEFNF